MNDTERDNRQVTIKTTEGEERTIPAQNDPHARRHSRSAPAIPFVAGDSALRIKGAVAVAEDILHYTDVGSVLGRAELKAKIAAQILSGAMTSDRLEGIGRSLRSHAERER